VTSLELARDRHVLRGRGRRRLQIREIRGSTSDSTTISVMAANCSGAPSIKSPRLPAHHVNLG
jgi:hypothetical protein